MEIHAGVGKETEARQTPFWSQLCPQILMYQSLVGGYSSNSESRNLQMAPLCTKTISTWIQSGTKCLRHIPYQNVRLITFDHSNSGNPLDHLPASEFDGFFFLAFYLHLSEPSGHGPHKSWACPSRNTGILWLIRKFVVVAWPPPPVRKVVACVPAPSCVGNKQNF